ncbi:Hypothetical predicted protein [Mytilus galloprovincialis]|uniref:Claudin n=1 Tax=Mytilus galloprovincialis TaxID=29158 RepID=A0A8B6BNR7_MYTGA|nr:Hypothetical predicted protein [Mytilus galloprovincialis]
MEVAGINLLTFVGFLLTITATVLDLIGFATPNWSKSSTPGVEAYAGLWSYCYTEYIGSDPVCGPISDFGLEEPWFKAVQAVETIGALCLLAASVVIILKLKVFKDKTILKFVCIGCLAAAAVFTLPGVIIYGVKIPGFQMNNIQMEDRFFGFAFVIIAAIIGIVASVLFCLDK